MYLYKNSFKRLYNKDSVYFLTSNTYRNIPYLSEEIFCQLFLDNLRICKQLKGFRLYGFVIIPWHVHLQIKPGKRFNISDVIHYLKRSVSFSINWVMGFNPQTVGEDLDPRLPEYRKKFIKKYGHPQYEIHQFRWQESFHDRRIRNEREFYQHLEYITMNPIKHHLTNDETGYPWSFLYPEYKHLIDD